MILIFSSNRFNTSGLVMLGDDTRVYDTNIYAISKRLRMQNISILTLKNRYLLVVGHRLPSLSPYLPIICKQEIEKKL